MLGLAKRAVSLAASAHLSVTQRELVARLEAIVTGLLVKKAQGIPKRDALDGAVLATSLVIGGVMEHLTGPLSLGGLVVLNE
jgi:hypothetical protein